MTITAALLVLGLRSSSPDVTSPVAPAIKPAAIAQTEPIPPKGNSLFGWGIFGVAFGLVNIGYGIPLTVDLPGDGSLIGLVPVGFGVGFVALGAVGIHYGKKRRAAWRAWAERNPQQAEIARHLPSPAPKGVPQLIVGTVLTGGGVATTVPMAMILHFNSNAPSFIYVLTSMGVSSILLGTGLLINGGIELRRGRRQLNARLQVVPTPWMTLHGAGLGLAGRF